MSEDREWIAGLFQDSERRVAVTIRESEQRMAVNIGESEQRIAVTIGESEQRVTALVVTEIKSLYGEIGNLHGEIGNLYGEIRNLHGEIGNLYGEIRNLHEKIERVETALLTAFHKWASPSEARARTHSAALRAIDIEIESLAERVTKLEPPQ